MELFIHATAVELVTRRAGRRGPPRSRQHRPACRFAKGFVAVTDRNRQIEAALGGSGKGAALPSPPPQRTVHASFPAYGSSIGQRTCHSTRLPALALTTTSTLLRESQQRNRRKPHQQERCAPADISALLPQVGLLTVHVCQHQREVCRLSPWSDVATPIRPITDRPSLAPSSSTRRLISFSCESSLPFRGDDGLTTFRRCHCVG